MKILDRYYNKFANKVRNLSILEKYPAGKELLKYSLVGNLSNLIDLGLYIFLTRAFVFWRIHYLSANVLAMLIASVVRFTFHKRWTFRDSSREVRKQYLKFVLVLFSSLILNGLILFLTVEVFSMNDIIGKLLAMLITTLFVYYVNKKWVFDHSKSLKN